LVKTIATPAVSQASITSASRRGWRRFLLPRRWGRFAWKLVGGGVDQVALDPLW